MLRSVLRNLSLRRKWDLNPAERFSVFLTLMSLDFKRAFHDKQKSLRSQRFFQYTVWGYSYFLLDYLFKEVFLSQEYFFKAANVRPLIFDCGANIGMSVLYFKKLYPESRIVAFEANPQSFGLLEKNISENQLGNVELHQVALSDHDGEISFFLSNEQGSLLASTRSDRGGTQEIKCVAKKLSDYLRDYESVDLIKMDVEGSELSIANELAAEGLLKKADQYIIEYHHNMDGDEQLSDFLKIFEKENFGYNIKASFLHLKGFQDVLIHFYAKN